MYKMNVELVPMSTTNTTQNHSTWRLACALASGSRALAPARSSGCIKAVPLAASLLWCWSISTLHYQLITAPASLDLSVEARLYRLDIKLPKHWIMAIILLARIVQQRYLGSRTYVMVWYERCIVSYFLSDKLLQVLPSTGLEAKWSFNTCLK